MAISHATGPARATMRKDARAEPFPKRAMPGPGPGLLDLFVAHLERRMDEGRKDAMALWREVRDQGCEGAPVRGSASRPNVGRPQLRAPLAEGCAVSILSPPR